MGPTALREKTTYTDKAKLNPAARDGTLRSKDNNQSVQETKPCLYIFFTSDTPNKTTRPAVVKVLRTVGGPGVKKTNNINTVQFLSQTDRFVSLDLNASSRAAGFNLVLSVYVVFSLKAVEPIYCHYMTDRLQRFELKFFVCVLLKSLDALQGVSR